MKIFQGPYEIDLQVSDKMDVGDDGKPDCGSYESDPPRITVREGLTAREAALTLLHEYVHHLSDSYGLGLSERHVLCLEMGLGELFVRNPHVIRLLVDSLCPSKEPPSSPSSPTASSGPSSEGSPPSPS